MYTNLYTYRIQFVHFGWNYLLTPILFGQFYHFEVAEYAFVDGEAQEGAYLVEAVYACSAGVHMQGVDAVVMHHLEDV